MAQCRRVNDEAGRLNQQVVEEDRIWRVDGIDLLDWVVICT